MIYTSLTNKALKIAYEAHINQTDKGGIPYIYHPFHLAEQMYDEVSVCCALLHDVVEDTDITFDDLETDFPPDVITVLRLLTHVRGTDYFEYIRAIKCNKVATAIKLADIAHNMDTSRLEGTDTIISEETKQRLFHKYKEAKRILEE